MQTRGQDATDRSVDEEERGRRRTSDERCRSAQTSRREQEQRSRGQRDAMSQQETTRHWHRDGCNHVHDGGERRDRMAPWPSRIDETCRDSLQNTLVVRSENCVTPGKLDGFAHFPPSGECVGNEPGGLSSNLMGLRRTDGSKPGVDPNTTPAPDR